VTAVQIACARSSTRSSGILASTESRGHAAIARADHPASAPGGPVFRNRRNPRTRAGGPAPIFVSGLAGAVAVLASKGGPTNALIRVGASDLAFASQQCGGLASVPTGCRNLAFSSASCLRRAACPSHFAM
jgi:hypothetical protein